MYVLLPISKMGHIVSWVTIHVHLSAVEELTQVMDVRSVKRDFITMGKYSNFINCFKVTVMRYICFVHYFVTAISREKIWYKYEAD